MIHKETFFQAADGCIPSHYVVQYWETAEGAFCEAQYFSTLEEAVEFEEYIKEAKEL